MAVQTRAQARQAATDRETQERAEDESRDSDAVSEEEDTTAITYLKLRVLWHFAAIAPETWLKAHIDEATPQTRQFLKTVSTILAYVEEDTEFGETLLRGSEVNILQPLWTSAMLKAMQDRLTFIKTQFGSVDVIDTGNSLRRWELGMRQISTALNACRAGAVIKLQFANEILEALEFIIESDYDLRRRRTQPSYAASSQAQYNLYHNMIDDDNNTKHFCTHELRVLVSGTVVSATAASRDTVNATKNRLSHVIRLCNEERNRRRLLNALAAAYQGM